MWRPEKDWDKEILDQYLIMSGWKPTNMQGALNLVGFVADAMLEALRTGATRINNVGDPPNGKGVIVFIPDEEE